MRTPSPTSPRAERLTQAWLKRGWLARCLWPVSVVMMILVRLRQGLFMSGLLASRRLEVPVLVVGNVVAGGAGKTPTVIALVQHLQARGFTPGVVSRGYGRTGKQVQAVQGSSSAHEVGDEPLLIHRRTHVPVWVGPNRVDVAQALLTAQPEVNFLVCDDGLQHLALQRDIEVCVFDDRGVGNGWLMPAGPLREPWPRAVDLVLHTGHQPAFEGVNCFRGQRQLGQAVQADGTLAALQNLPGPVLAVAGIAQPQAFFDMLRAQGLELARTMALPDHVNFDSVNLSEFKGYNVVCTEKDAVKLWPVMPQAWAVPLQFTPEPAFFKALDGLLGDLQAL